MYKTVILKRDGYPDKKAIFDSSRQLLILGYMDAAYAKQIGYTWEEMEQTDGIHALLSEQGDKE